MSLEIKFNLEHYWEPTCQLLDIGQHQNYDHHHNKYLSTMASEAHQTCVVLSFWMKGYILLNHCYTAMILGAH